MKNSFRYEKDKFSAAKLTKRISEDVKPFRIAECPLQVESKVKNITIPRHDPEFAIVEAEAIKIHAHKRIVTEENHIDVREWSPLIYNFRHYFGLGSELGKTFRA